MLNYYSYNLNIFPSWAKEYAVAYLLKILTILLTHNQQYYPEISKQLNKIIKKVYNLRAETLQPLDINCEDLVKMCDEYSKVSEIPVEVKEKKPAAEPAGDQPQDDIKEVPKDKSLGSDDEHNVSGEEANK